MSTLPNGLKVDETTWDSPNYTPAASVPAVYGQARNITGVTVHWWGDPAQNPQFNATANYLSRANGNTSAHFVVEDGRVACLISPENAAWHAGSAAGNATTIGIECNPRCTQGDLETLAQTIAWLEGLYGDMRVYGHRDWSSTACPGYYYDKLSWVIDRVNAIRGGKTSSPAQSTPAQSSQPSGKVQPQWIVEKGDTLYKIQRYYAGPSVQDIAKANGIQTTTPLKVGQVLNIPGPLEWAVDPGDTWEKIAAYYALDAGYLRSINRGKELTVGTVLTIF